jgi:polysaccharide biosynthesis/export protein
MERMSRRIDLASAVFLSLCVGLAGCLNLGEDQSAQPSQYLPARASAPMLPSASANPTGYAPMPQGPLTASVVGGSIKQANFTGQAEPAAKPQGELVLDQAHMGEPTVAGMATPNLPLPTEKMMATHPPHRVAAPDILHIEALRLVPRGPYKLEALEVVSIDVGDTLPKQDIKGLFMISPEGTINLGYNYGYLRIAGLTVDQAQAALRNHLAPILKNPTINLALVQMRGQQNIRGEHLVRPDGTIGLGMYGSVFVAGMTLGQVKTVVENHLSAYLVDPQISVDVFAYNSRKIYIIADGAGYGQQVIKLPATGNETVLDAIAQVQGLPAVASLKKIWVARPSPAGHPCSQVLPVDWQAITQGGRTETNYQLLPGDRIYISADPLIVVYNFIDKVLAPIERVLGVTLLGQTVAAGFGPGGLGGAGFLGR